MCDRVHGTIGVDANKVWDASHPFPLIGGIAPCANDECLERLLVRKLGDVAEAERPDGGGRDRSCECGPSFFDDPGGEHRLSPPLDSFRQDVARDVEAEDRRQVAGLACPQSVRRRLQRGAELGELERPDDSAPVVAMNAGRGTWVAFRENAVCTLRPESVVELFPAGALLSRG